MEYDWKEINKKWSDKLMSDKFYIKNCLGDGNCQFHAIKTALGTKKTHIQLRNRAADTIKKLSDKEFNHILQTYQLEQQTGEFVGKWNPDEIKSPLQFIKQLKKPGFNFQGDNITLSLLSRSLNVDFVIFDKKFNITNLSNPDQLNEKLTILFYDGNHYQSIGLKINNTIYTIFDRHSIPVEIDRLIDKHSFYLTHILSIVKNLQKITLNKILIELQKKMIYIGIEDNKIILPIIRQLLESREFFNSTNSKIKNII